MPSNTPTKFPTVSPIAKFIAELGVLKHVPIAGLVLAGVTEQQFLAGHILRAAQIAFVLATLEGANPERTSTIVLFHDNAEVRVGDQHKVAARYFCIADAEAAAFKDQVSQLPDQLPDMLMGYFRQFEARNTKEALVAKDSDWLETAVTAKELMEQGYPKSLQNWIDNVGKALTTASAQQLLTEISNTEEFTCSWWQGLKKMTY